MSSPQVASYGTWKSPISADIFAKGAVELDQVEVDPSNGKIFLAETRPAEEGRACIVEYSNNGKRDVLPKQYSAKTSVHEYGGASFAVNGSGLVFADDSSKTVFALDLKSGNATAIVDADDKNRFADFDTHPSNPDWVIAILEDHHKHPNVVNTLVAIQASSKSVRIIASGADFYAYPRFSPDGKSVCWVQWDDPDMPWTGTLLYTAEWQEGKLGKPQLIAGGPRKISVSQPRWAPDGTLFYVDDRTGYWQIYKKLPGKDASEYIHVKGYEQGEFTCAEWFLGTSTYAPLTSDTLIAMANKDGIHRLLVVDVESGSYTDPGFPINEVVLNALKRISDTSFAVIGATSTAPKTLYHLDISNPSKITTLRASTDVEIPMRYFSKAESITFPRFHGPGGGESHALFLPPTNPDFRGPEGELPPLIVACHGGPTDQVGSGLILRDQYWTSRGYALAQINYVGSTGYGREYADKLNAEWGVSDIADAVSCIEYLGKQKLIDVQRVGITGQSSGGFATLQALCMYPKVFAAGVSEYGISDMQGMFDDTHKFESRYLYELCFPADTPEEQQKKVIKERSPLLHANRVEAPLLLLQGTEDMIVPVNQAEQMAQVIRKKGGDVKLIIYPGEGHNFHNGVNVKDSVVQAERWFQRTLVK